jgi:hypothetical protein
MNITSREEYVGLMEEKPLHNFGTKTPKERDNLKVLGRDIVTIQHDHAQHRGGFNKFS